MSRTEAIIEDLAKIHPKGFDLSLDRITKLLASLNNPHKLIPPAIHVAGTNGKGSTLAFLRSILEAAGSTVHVHTSPHLVNWQERYRLAGTLVDDHRLAEAIERVAEANNGAPITIFEIMSAVMFVLFSEHEADYSLVEVGLGGRFDATNVIENPSICAIAPVALDHQAYLGETLEEIAFEKAGIIKPGCPVVIGFQEDRARQVIEEVAAKKQAPAFAAGQDFDCYRDGNRFTYQDSNGLLDLPMPALLGEHQLENAGLAIAAIRHGNFGICDAAIEAGMLQVSWPGRMQRLPAGKLTALLGGHGDIWIDGGHNPAAGKAVSRVLTEQRTGNERPLILVCGMINTKEPVGYFEAFKPLSPHVISVPVASSDAGIEPEDLMAFANRAGLRGQAAINLENGIEMAAELLKTEPTSQLVFCGSLYMVGDVLDRNGTPPE